MSSKTFYLENQVVAREKEPVFALRLSQASWEKIRGLALAPGDSIAVVDAAQDYHRCEIISLSDDELIVRVAQRSSRDTVGPHIRLVQGLSDDEAMETIVKQVSEIGVAEVIPFRSTFSPGIDSQRASELVDRWRSLARYAARQAGLRRMPEVRDVLDIAGACALLETCDVVFLCWEDESERSIGEAIEQAGSLVRADGADIALIVGPRGGLTDAEMSRLGDCNENLLTVSLGPSILRVETASLVAPTLLIYGLGGLH